MKKLIDPNRQAKRVSLVTFKSIADLRAAQSYAAKVGLGLGPLMRSLLFKVMNGES